MFACGQVRTMMTEASDVLKFDGSNYLRQRLILSTLSGKAVKVKDIRSRSDDPGLKEFEVNLVRLLDKVTNGSTVEVNETGTSLFYQPGLLFGGHVEHECCKARGIGYYLEVLIALAPFCKKPLNAVLKGVTNCATDISVDVLHNVARPILRRFLGTDEGLEFSITKRGMAPGGGGEIVFKCPVRKQLKPLQLEEPGKIKRVRGVVYAVRVSPAIANRLVESAKGIILKFLPDVYIHTDHCTGTKSGKSPGFGIALYAETTSGVVYTGEMVSRAAGANLPPSVPEDIGREAAYRLLEEVYRGGCVDSVFQSHTTLFMALTPKDVSVCITGPLSPYAIQFLRHMKEYFNLAFKLDVIETIDNEDELNVGSKKVKLTCVGVGFTNLSKRVA
ncbi:RNA 3'-terminal phosphate cyclase-like protein [Schistocerca serialis cubense]|uniref:RNA 3'-terminal phosphate cyclase-like protein n=1 Tax=Schistocerca serialis cubense TaxID=2023355 RepID=UPI00214E7CA5|nr:RNA 3'-terminal phosphate cyclase-like protein [Schistocerca serialis cubense]